MFSLTSQVAQDRRERYPDSPWLWRRDWAEGRIRSNLWLIAILASIFSATCGAISISLLLSKFDELGRDPGVIAMLFAFGGLAVGMLVWATIAVARWWRFRDLYCELATIPGVLGGKLAGTIHIGRILMPASSYEVSIECIRVRRSGKTRYEDEVWRHEQRVAPGEALRGHAGSAIPFSFIIPYELPESMLAAVRGEQIVWRLALNAKLEGADLAGGFEVPVFETGESSEAISDRGPGPQQADVGRYRSG
jgi:hypothetical protein